MTRGLYVGSVVAAIAMLASGVGCEFKGIGSYVDRNVAKSELDCPTPQIPWQCFYKISEVAGAGSHEVLVCAETTAEAWDTVRRGVPTYVCSISCVPYDPSNPQPSPKSHEQDADTCEPIAPTCIDEGSDCVTDEQCCAGLFCDATCVL